jgi:thiol:disulfide interchange protein DsbD
MRFLALALCFFYSILVSGQIYNPVKWAFDFKPTGNGEYLFTAKATIDEGWWVYSQHLENEDGPIATTVFFDEGPHFKLVGKNKESDNIKKIFDKVFEMNISKFQHYYTIEQKIKVIDPSKPITGVVNFMTCNDERCLPPTDAEFNLKATPVHQVIPILNLRETDAKSTAKADTKTTA